MQSMIITDIDREHIGDYITMFNSFNDEEPLYIYITSTGGEYDIAKVIINIINKWKGGVHIKAVGFCCSSGMSILLMTKGYKYVESNTIGMIHTISTEFDDRERRKDTRGFDYTKVHSRTLEIENQELVNFYRRLGVNEDCLDLILKGEDVWINDEQMRELCRKAENLYRDFKVLTV